MYQLKKNKSISKVVGWNVVGSFFLKGVALISAPIFTRLLLPSDYGFISLYTAWLGFFSLLVGLQTYGAIANAKITYNENELNKFLSSIMTISVLSFIVILMLVILFNKLLSNLLNMNGTLVILLVIHSFCLFVVNFYTTKLMQFKEVEKNLLVSVVISLIAIIFSILLILLFTTDKYLGKIIGSATPNIIFGLFFLFLIYYKGRVLYNKEYWNFCLKLTLPLILHSAGAIILSQSDRVMLDKFVGKSEVGIYSFSYTLALIVATLWGAFNTSWVPFYYEYKKNKDKELILKKSKNYMIVFSIITIEFVLFAHEVYKILAPKNYWPGIVLIPLIALAYYFNFLYAFPANHEFFHKKTLYISLGTLLAAGINIACNFILIPRYIGIGAVVGTLIAHIFLFLFHDFIARFVIKDLEYSFVFYLKGLIPVVVVVVLYYIFYDFWTLRWGAGILLGVFLLHRIIKTKGLF